MTEPKRWQRRLLLGASIAPNAAALGGCFVNQQPVNKTEAFVLAVSRRSFLSLWCDSNPQGKNPSTELCDILVVCDPHVIVISVKEVQYQSDKDHGVASKRWQREAINASVKQIYGAERWLGKATHVVRKDGSPGLRLPPPETRRVHRIAVAIGGRGEILIKSGDFGKGYVHVMSESGFEDVLTELDTITDLTGYLAAKEVSAAAGCNWLVFGENNLLGFYLLNNKAFPTDVDLVLVDDTHWDGLRERDDYKRKKKADEVSYYWDRLIAAYTGPNGELLDNPGQGFSEFEFALRTMAREDRFDRRMLGRGLTEFLDQALSGGLRTRCISGRSGVIYVVMLFNPNEDRERRGALLCRRCAFARHHVGRGEIVIGIAFVENEQGAASVRELLHFDARNWTAADDEQAANEKAELNYNSFVTTRQVEELEYPTTD